MNSNNLFPTLLLLIFITLKLTGHITWSWWWVLSPMWIPVVVVLCIFAFYGTYKVLSNK